MRSDGESSTWAPTAYIDLLALARSPEDLRSTLSAAQAKYRVAGVAPTPARMAR